MIGFECQKPNSNYMDEYWCIYIHLHILSGLYDINAPSEASVHPSEAV